MIDPIQFKTAIKKAMEQLNISEKKATCELLLFMCGYGSIDDFKEFMNYFIEVSNKDFKTIKK